MFNGFDFPVFGLNTEIAEVGFPIKVALGGSGAV
jgi:hypothetical protein